MCLRHEAGIDMCNVTHCCTEVCPEKIQITDLTVRRPYRLDLTVDALHRIRTKVVDVMTEAEHYLYALRRLAW